jgi:signal transduction histidine kinase
MLHAWSSSVYIDDKFTSAELVNTLKANKPSVPKDDQYTFAIHNKKQTEQQLYLSIINPNIDSIVILDNGKQTVLGDMEKYSKRSFKHSNHVYPLLLHADETRTLSVTLKKQWYPVNYKMVLSSENHFIRTTNHDNFFSGIFYGIVFMYLLILICFYIFSKNIFFLIYFFIQIFTVLLFFQFSGNGYQYAWFFSPAIQRHIAFFALIGYFAGHITFIRYFFGVQFKNTISGIIVKLTIAVLVLFCAVFLYQFYIKTYDNRFFGAYPYLLYGIFGIYGLLILFLGLFIYRTSRRREIVWVLIGTFMHICAWILFINNEYGMIDLFNSINSIQLFTSNLYISQLNYYIALLEMFVVSIFIAINYNNLIRQNNISVKRLEFLQKRNINTFVLGQEEEREKITTAINEGISADIVRLREQLVLFNQTIKDKTLPAQVLNDVDKTLQDINNITSNYVAPDMQEMILSEIILTATDKLYSGTTVQYNFDSIPDSMRLNSIANINIYRILQEISNNILKHSKATEVDITAIKDAKTLQIKINDNGIGFSDNVKDSLGIGMLNIESRVNSLNGNLYVISNETRGSTIHLIIPLKDIS